LYTLSLHYALPIFPESAAFPIVIKVSPNFEWLCRLDSSGPGFKFITLIIMPVPAFRSVKTQINGRSGLQDSVRQAWGAHGTKNNAVIFERDENTLVPPSG